MDDEVVERADRGVVEAADGAQVVDQGDDLELAGGGGVVRDVGEVADQVVVSHLQQEVVVLLAADYLEERCRIARQNEQEQEENKGS